ncbi:HesA/MoeB/ThiF family protein [Psychrosphaera ytuae]|uniref:HesA/MoeB/ThiF family protein n=1 Tax=Psychrosphaera ytuae TaxID=2820710 RepID=A0A975HHV0_9GAMM|nr:HesA/MoeB/ThiF family protein [Psychrosphaera ytuae]QTH63571.1 HesA/MoeB/ThiF family protein [Psychrosphaera ytuae]
MKNNQALSDTEFLRYNRHIMVKDIGEKGQLALKQATVLIVGLGGLGCPASQYLAASGIGNIILVDHDKVERSNLQRQILFTEPNIGQSKVQAAQAQLAKLNSEINISVYGQSITEFDAPQWWNQFDLVLDCTDNSTSRYFINQQCLKYKKILISGSAIQHQGQLISFDFSQADSPCYQCLFPESSQTPLNCQTAGVISPLLGVIGSMQASTALACLLNKPINHNQLITFDGFNLASRSLTVAKDPDCIHHQPCHKS